MYHTQGMTVPIFFAGCGLPSITHEAKDKSMCYSWNHSHIRQRKINPQEARKEILVEDLASNMEGNSSTGFGKQCAMESTCADGRLLNIHPLVVIHTITAQEKPCMCLGPWTCITNYIYITYRGLAFTQAQGPMVHEVFPVQRWSEIPYLSHAWSLISSTHRAQFITTTFIPGVLKAPSGKFNSNQEWNDAFLPDSVYVSFVYGFAKFASYIEHNFI